MRMVRCEFLLPQKLLDDIEKHAKKYGYKDRSEVIRTACRLILEQPNGLVRMFYKKFEGEHDAGH